ncbi:unnamed protein product [Gadus morhua 'NCC']
MEENPPPLKHYLTCSLCTEIFKDPVSLGCHHSFCSSCLQDFWAQAKNKNCPVCKRKNSKDIVDNFSLKELADSYAGRQRSDPSDEAQVRRSRHQELLEKYGAMPPHLMGQWVTERRIRAEFEQLHLRGKEEVRVEALERERILLERERKLLERERILLQREILQEQIRSLASGSRRTADQAPMAESSSSCSVS